MIQSIIDWMFPKKEVVENKLNIRPEITLLVNDLKSNWSDWKYERSDYYGAFYYNNIQKVIRIRVFPAIGRWYVSFESPNGPVQCTSDENDLIQQTIYANNEKERKMKEHIQLNELARRLQCGPSASSDVDV